MNIQITSTQDFLEALRANPEFLNAARKEILTEDLIQLPTRTDQEFREVKRDLGQVKGIGFGIDIGRRGMPKVVAQHRLHRARVVRLAENNGASEEFNEAMLVAFRNKVITEPDYVRVMRTDLIVCGQQLRPPGTTVYLVAEASFTLELKDLVNVQKTRDALRKVFPQDTAIGCLYTADISDELRSVATRDGVGIFIETDFGVPTAD